MKASIQRPLRVAEFFAGVGGFRIGLEAVHGAAYEVVWSNQHEPGKAKQIASSIYKATWPNECHLNKDIFEVLACETDYNTLRVANPDVIVGGFPCQDYSVARPLSQSKGLVGKKGVLWWSLVETLRKRQEDGEPVKYAIFENVDRLLTSPSTCRGRDFAIILSSLAQLGYAVEWRVVNAADYGFPQKRKRVFILASHRTTALYQRTRRSTALLAGAWMQSSVFSRAFPARFPAPGSGYTHALTLDAEPFDTQLRYRSRTDGSSWFHGSGVMVGGRVWTTKALPAEGIHYADFTGHDRPLTLGDVTRASSIVTPAYYLEPASIERWRYLKSAKREARTSPTGFQYEYAEGALAFPDRVDRPGRTILTSEGGSAPSRTKHVVMDATGKLRRLTPEELEALQGFPRGHTDHPDATAIQRGFLMGNALVTGLVRRIGEALHDAHARSAFEGDALAGRPHSADKAKNDPVFKGKAA